jgi:hypothetical protein
VDEAQERQLLDVVMVAKECVREKADMRPSMQDVVAALYNANSKDYSSSDSEASNDVSPASSQACYCAFIKISLSLSAMENVPNPQYFVFFSLFCFAETQQAAHGKPFYS